MILSNHFVFIHIQKTGGTWLREMFNGFSPWPWDVRIRSAYHQGVKDIPPEYRDKPRFAVVRNPWDWYVSKYEYAHQRLLPHCQLDDRTWLPEFREYIDACSYSFEAALPYLLKPKQDLAWQLNYQLDNSVDVLRFENLRTDVASYIKKVTPKASHRTQPYRQFEHRLIHSKKRNASKHGDYREYYDARLRKMVEKHEATMIQRFGYAF